MKKIAILILFMLAFFNAKCQSDTLTQTSINCDTLTTDADWKTDSLLSETFNRWESKDFILLLKKHKVGKIDCEGCEGVTAKIQFYINKDGNIQSINILQSNKCGSSFDEKFKLDFINS